MSTTEPTMVDVTAAVLKSHARDKNPDTDTALDVLSFVARQQQAEAAWRENTTWAYVHDAEARVRLLSDGLAWALDQVEYGGTTAQYERCLDRIRMVHSLSYGGPILDWYKQTERDHHERVCAGGGAMVPDDRPVHPMFRFERDGAR